MQLWQNRSGKPAIGHHTVDQPVHTTHDSFHIDGEILCIGRRRGMVSGLEIDAKLRKTCRNRAGEGIICLIEHDELQHHARAFSSPDDAIDKRLPVILHSAGGRLG